MPIENKTSQAWTTISELANAKGYYIRDCDIELVLKQVETLLRKEE